MQGKIMALACCAALLLGGCATKQQKQPRPQNLWVAL